jgi:hypothetical protein
MVRDQDDLGEALQLARFIPLVAARGIDVTIELPSKLLGLRWDFPPSVKVEEKNVDRPYGSFTYEMWNLTSSLPAACGHQGHRDDPVAGPLRVRARKPHRALALPPTSRPQDCHLVAWR